jgi:hypothetical protein
MCMARHKEKRSTTAIRLHVKAQLARQWKGRGEKSLNKSRPLVFLLDYRWLAFLKVDYQPNVKLFSVLMFFFYNVFYFSDYIIYYMFDLSYSSR